MGNCQHCGKSIKILNYEENCPNCSNFPYSCWNCQADVRGGKECAACHFFVCKSCGECGPDCKLEYLKKESEGKTPEEIIVMVLNFKQGNLRANCPEGVGISYAKGKLRNIALKLKGYYIKEKDLEEFKIRINEISNFPIGKRWKISEIKEDGYYGVEYRESSNLGICMGWVKKSIEKDKYKNQVEVFTRVMGKPCEQSNWHKLLINKCPICKKKYSIETNTCPDFNCRYKKGKEKGELRKLKQQTSHCDFCSLPRKEFIKKDIDVENGCSGTLR